MTSTPVVTNGIDPTRAQDSRRWLALVFVALAQLMIALDATIMNISLPSAQAALGFSDADRQWVITAYTLAFGGLLLLGGRISDHLGRTRTFVIGLTGFALASALGGLAPNLAVLTLARAGQGAFGALLAPTVLALLAVTFAEPRERGKAFAIFGAIAGGGGAAGLILGGLLAETISWRGCLFVNVPIAAVAALGTRYLPRVTPGTARERLDVTGAVLVTAGLIAVVAGCSRAADRGWTSPLTLLLLGSGAALLAGFTGWESRAAAPLLPMRILADRNLVGACVTVGFAVAGMLGLFLFLTYFLQVVLGYSPILAGLAFLPLSTALFAAAQLAGRLMAQLPPRALIVPGLSVATIGMMLLTRLTPDSGYPGGVLPAEILLGLGMGLVFTPAISLATSRVPPRDAGIVAAVVATCQQIGGSLGVAVLNTVAAATVAAHLATHPATPTARTAALVHGYTTAAGWATGIFATAAVLATVLITADRPTSDRTRSGASADTTHR
ncbi:MAG: MFS transporter [Pseudonocardiaceae bacterium]